MEEELLRQILQEIQSQSGTSWLEFLQLFIPAIVGLVGGLAGAAVGFYAVKRSSESQLAAVRLTTQADVDKISIERRLEWRRERYLTLIDALAEYIAALDYMLDAEWRYAVAVFDASGNEQRYSATYDACRDRFEEIRSSGRLSEARLKIGDKDIGKAILTLAIEAEQQYIAMIRFAMAAVTEFQNSGVKPGSGTKYWPQEHLTQRDNIDEAAHQVSQLIEERISLTD